MIVSRYQLDYLKPVTTNKYRNETKKIRRQNNIYRISLQV